MATIEIETVLAHSTHEVWEQLRHIDRHVQWMGDAQRIDFHSDQREGVGTGFDCVTRIGPFTTRDVMEVTEWRDGVAMGVAHQGLFSGRGQFSLRDDPVGTRLTWREELRFPWWFAGPLGAWVARPVLRHVWRQNLAAFARTLPATTTGDVTGDATSD